MSVDDSLFRTTDEKLDADTRRNVRFLFVGPGLTMALWVWWVLPVPFGTALFAWLPIWAFVNWQVEPKRTADILGALRRVSLDFITWAIALAFARRPKAQVRGVALLPEQRGRKEWSDGGNLLDGFKKIPWLKLGAAAGLVIIAGSIAVLFSGQRHAERFKLDQVITESRTQAIIHDRDLTIDDRSDAVRMERVRIEVVTRETQADLHEVIENVAFDPPLDPELERAWRDGLERLRYYPDANGSSANSGGPGSDGAVLPPADSARAGDDEQPRDVLDAASGERGV